MFTHRLISDGPGVRRREWLRTRWGWWLPVGIAWRRTPRRPPRRVYFSDAGEPTTWS